MTETVPKAELHVHLEGTMRPDLTRRLAERNGMTLPSTLFTPDGGYRWTDFLDFLRAYDDAASVIRTPEDYRDVTRDYLVGCAAEGAVYGEVMSSPDHAAAAGMSYRAHLDGIVAGIEEAKALAGIEGRLIVTCVRHFGPERAVEVARAVVRHPHPLVTGFGMGGDENFGRAADYAPAFRIVHEEAGLPCTVHAGEAAGAESVADALEHLPVRRIGHGVRAVEDERVLAQAIEAGIVFEVCPTSNVATRVYPGYAAHPFGKLIEAGARVTLNSDDPPYFGTSIGREYAVAAEAFGLTEAELRGITRTAIEGAFVDEPTRGALLARVGDTYAAS